MKKNKILIIGVIILFLLIILPIPSLKQSIYYFFSPASKKLNSSSETATSFFNDLINIKNLSKENEELRKSNNQLNAENVKLTELKVENEELRRELDFKNSNTDKKLVLANIISKSPTAYLQTMILDKGEEDQVSQGQCVLSEGYLVGIISKIYPNYSEVELITSPKTLIPIILQNSRSTGLLKSNLKGLFIDNVPIDDKVSLDEEVLTNNLDKNIPNGIAIGKIKKITNYQSQIFQNLEVQSPIKFSKIKFVMILQN